MAKKQATGRKPRETVAARKDPRALKAETPKAPVERTREGDTAPRVAAARRRGPRTAGGKKMDPSTLANAEQDSREGLRERTEVGHIKAGRTPPSQQSEPRRAAKKRVIDEAIRDFVE